jgi:hypothetical protein
VNINVNRVFELKKELDEINGQDLDGLVFIQNGEEVSPARHSVKEWAFIGLNNTDFILSNFSHIIEE